MDRSTVERGDIQENHLGDRDRNQQRGDRKNIGHARVDARHELMVRPHDEAQEADGPRRVQNGLVTEQFLARENRQDFRHDTHGWKQYDVDFRMAEKPEQVLPQKRIAAARADRKSRWITSGRIAA